MSTHIWVGVHISSSPSVDPHTHTHTQRYCSEENVRVTSFFSVWSGKLLNMFVGNPTKSIQHALAPFLFLYLRFVWHWKLNNKNNVIFKGIPVFNQIEMIEKWAIERLTFDSRSCSKSSSLWWNKTAWESFGIRCNEYMIRAKSTRQHTSWIGPWLVVGIRHTSWSLWQWLKKECHRQQFQRHCCHRCCIHHRAMNPLEKVLLRWSSRSVWCPFVGVDVVVQC